MITANTAGNSIVTNINKPRITEFYENSSTFFEKLLTSTFTEKKCYFRNKITFILNIFTCK